MSKCLQKQRNAPTLIKCPLFRSDADSDVLADYVLALVKSEDPEHEVQQKCREELIDFLGDSMISYTWRMKAVTKESQIPRDSSMMSLRHFRSSRTFPDM